MDSKKHKKQKERTKSHSDSPGSTNGKPIEQDRRGSQSQQPSVTLSPRKKSTNAESRLNDGNSNAGLSPPELVFYVVGGDVVGKSTFIRCALDLKKSNLSPVACKKMSLEGEVFLINLLEMPLSSVDVTDQVVTWPGSVGDVEVSRPDGVLALYDVTDKRSMSQVPMLLSEFCTKKSFDPPTL